MARPVYEMFSHAAAGSAAEPQVWWRLVAGNRRELGRCPVAFGDAAAATAAVHSLIDDLAEAIPRLDVERRSQKWRWSLRVGHDVRAVSTRGYSRRVECQLSLQQFLFLAPTAAVENRLRVYGVRRDLGGDDRSRSPAREMAIIRSSGPPPAMTSRPRTARSGAGSPLPPEWISTVTRAVGAPPSDH